MSEIGEAIGTAAEGGLLAGAAQPSGKARKLGKDHSLLRPDACLNCGAVITDRHCGNCGQKAVVHRSIKAIGHDVLHGVLHLDGKIWRTLPLLFFKPGRLTRRYINGERTKFVSPMAMFLFSVFLMFAVFQALGITAPTDLDATDVEIGNVEIDDEVKISVTEARSQMQAELEKSRAQLAGLPAGNPDREDIAKTIAAQEALIERTAQADAIMEQAEEGTLEFSGTGIDWIDQGLIEKWKKNPGLMLYKLQTNFYKFSWALIPLSIPFVWSLFFWKRRFKAYDHAIFVTYSLGFMSLLFVGLSVLGRIGVPTQILVLAGIFAPPLHIYKQLKYTYDLTRHGAFWRTMALTNGIVFGILGIFLWLLLLLGAF